MHKEHVSPLLVDGHLYPFARLLLYVVFHEGNDVREGFRRDAGARADIQLLDRSFLVQLRGGYTKLLAEEFSDFAADEGIIHAERTNLGASSAQGAPVGELGQPCEKGEVQLDVARRQLREYPILLLQVLVDDAAKHLGAKGRPIYLLLSARHVGRARVVAKLAFDAIVEGVDERLEKGPVVLLCQQFPQS